MSESGEMPADVRETVRVLFRNMVIGDPVIQTVERAILAERLRCMRAAADYFRGYDPKTHIAKDIAAAILDPES